MPRRFFFFFFPIFQFLLVSTFTLSHFLLVVSKSFMYIVTCRQSTYIASGPSDRCKLKVSSKLDHSVILSGWKIKHGCLVLALDFLHIYIWRSVVFNKHSFLKKRGGPIQYLILLNCWTHTINQTMSKHVFSTLQGSWDRFSRGFIFMKSRGCCPTQMLYNEVAYESTILAIASTVFGSPNFFWRIFVSISLFCTHLMTFLGEFLMSLKRMKLFHNIGTLNFREFLSFYRIVLYSPHELLFVLIFLMKYIALPFWRGTRGYLQPNILGLRLHMTHDIFSVVMDYIGQRRICNESIFARFELNSTYYIGFSILQLASDFKHHIRNRSNLFVRMV